MANKWPIISYCNFLKPAKDLHFTTLIVLTSSSKDIVKKKIGNFGTYLTTKKMTSYRLILFQLFKKGIPWTDLQHCMLHSLQMAQSCRSFKKSKEAMSRGLLLIRWCKSIGSPDKKTNGDR